MCVTKELIMAGIRAVMVLMSMVMAVTEAMTSAVQQLIKLYA